MKEKLLLFFKILTLGIIFLSCSTNIKDFFKEGTAQKTEEITPEEGKEVAESFKVEPPLIYKKKVKKPPLIKKEIKSLPEEFKPFEEIDFNSKKVWESYNPNLTHEEEIVMKVAFFGVTVGYMKINLEPMAYIRGNKVYHMSVRLKSANFYSFIYSLDNVVNSYIDAQKIVPLKYSLIQRESKQNVDDLQIFDLEKRQTLSWYKREKIKTQETTQKNETAYLPIYFQDSLSTLFFTRGLSFAPGKVIEFPLVNRGKILIVKLKVLGVEELKIQNKFQKAFKIEASSYPLEGQKKDGYVLFWYSQDYEQRLLKFSAKVKFGNVSGEIVDYKKGSPLNLEKAP